MPPQSAAIELSRQASSSKASVTKKAGMQGSRPRPVKAGQLASGQRAARPGALLLKPLGMPPVVDTRRRSWSLLLVRGHHPVVEASACSKLIDVSEQQQL